MRLTQAIDHDAKKRYFNGHNIILRLNDVYARKG